TAYDMNKGEIAWQIANGDAPQAIKENPALKGVNVPRTGSPGARAVLLVTKTLLFAGEGSSGAPILRAYDKRTGQIVWETTVPTGQVQSLPMTYMHNGKQYIVFASANPATQTPAQLVAYWLPPAGQPAGKRGGGPPKNLFGGLTGGGGRGPPPFGRITAVIDRRYNG